MFDIIISKFIQIITEGILIIGKMQAKTTILKIINNTEHETNIKVEKFTGVFAYKLTKVDCNLAFAISKTQIKYAGNWQILKLVFAILRQIFIFSLKDSPSKTMKSVFCFI